MPKKTPKYVEEKIARMISGWETLAPEKSFGGLTLTQFRAAAQPSLDARERIDNLENQSRQALSDREDADEAFLEKAELVVNGVRADPTEGPDSALYEAFGYTPKRDRKSGLSRKPKTTDPE
ncbi:MAG TPA: hypothetical protein VF658_02330 [Pyrinomonadaceae bacterium]|jgi:hypothetical protein